MLNPAAPIASMPTRLDLLTTKPSDPPTDPGRGASQATTWLAAYAFIIMVVPSDVVFRPIGGAAYLAGLIGMTIFALWLASTLLGSHDPRASRYPTRGAIALLWIISLMSYAAMHHHIRPGSQLLAADRWLMELAQWTGVAFVASECLRSLADIKKVLNALVWGGAVCGVVASLQFWFRYDISRYLRMLPGFTVNAVNPFLASRGGLNRVAGTAIHPIELGSVAGLLLPLAAFMAIYGRPHVPLWRRWFPVVCIGLAIPVSVSRSAVLAAGLALGLFVILLPAVQRALALASLPVALGAIFMTAHGFIGTISAAFTGARTDSSITHRTMTYPYVQQMVHQAPWIGSGGGTFLPPDSWHVLDNQYLHTAIELGILGVFVLVLYFTTPILTALVARGRTDDPELRTLCGALAGSALAAATCSATFDSLSFPMFAGVAALVVGLVGACWVIVERNRPAEASRSIRTLRKV